MAQTTIEIPVALAKMLSAEKSDMKDPKQFENLQEVSKSLLKVIVEANK